MGASRSADIMVSAMLQTLQMRYIFDSGGSYVGIWVMKNATAAHRASKLMSWPDYVEQRGP